DWSSDVCSSDLFLTPVDFAEDRVRVLGPDKTSRRFVVVLKIAVDGGDEVGDALEGPASNAVAGNFSEPALDQIEPRAAGGDEVKVHARMTAEPALNRRTFVRAQIVEHDMNGFVGGRRRIDPIEKPHKFLRVALRAAGAEDGPIQDAQR